MIDLIKTALMITGFVLGTMLLIEYVNVLSAGSWQKRLAQHAWGQYVVAAFLGATPGCLGAFAAVAMYSHGVLTLGAVVAAMIAASGDEAFVMLAMIPAQALVLIGILFVFGAGVGVIVDLLSRNRRSRAGCLEIHGQDRAEYYARGRIIEQWRECSAARGTLAVTLILFVAAVIIGQLAPEESGWIRATLVAVSGIALFIVATVPDHFLEEHLWRHVFRKHAMRILLWTLGALVAMHLLTDVLELETTIRQGKWVVLLVACLVGLIPESGPHLIFVTLFAQGVIPFSVLVASSVVQDGHGMLPMLAHSRREFLIVKAITFCAGVGLGAAALALGF
jgi:hypothetical protein